MPPKPELSRIAARRVRYERRAKRTPATAEQLERSLRFALEELQATRDRITGELVVISSLCELAASLVSKGRTSEALVEFAKAADQEYDTLGECNVTDRLATSLGLELPPPPGFK